MRFYIASRLANHGQVRRLAGLLKDAGWEHTYDWTAHDLGEEMDGETLQAIAQKEAEGVKNADVVIVLTPQGRGTHVEMGMAIALHKRVYLCHEDDWFFQCDDNTSTFYWLPNMVRFVGSIEALAERVRADCAAMPTADR